jgi:kumamolisin
LTENVWNDGSAGGATGGGVSSVHAIPAWQKSANVPGGTHRGVPDVGGLADPETGWTIVIDGGTYVIGGTSAVAPMWAALAAVLSQALGKNVGFLNPHIYALAGWSRDVVVGNNGTYTARPGYDCCTGMGVPVGTKLLAALAGPAPAPAPTPNPAPPPAPVPSPPAPTPPTPTVHTLTFTSGYLDGKAV